MKPELINDQLLSGYFDYLDTKPVRNIYVKPAQAGIHSPGLNNKEPETETTWNH